MLKKRNKIAVILAVLFSLSMGSLRAESWFDKIKSSLSTVAAFFVGSSEQEGSNDNNNGGDQQGSDNLVPVAPALPAANENVGFFRGIWNRVTRFFVGGYEDQINNLEDELNAERARIIVFERENQRLAQEKDEADSALVAERFNLSRDKMRLEGEIAQNMQNADQLTEQVAGLFEAKNNLETKINQLMVALQNMSGRIDGAVASHNTQNQELENQGAIIVERNRIIEELEAQKSHIQECFGESAQDLMNVRQEKEEKEQELVSLKADVVNIQREGDQEKTGLQNTVREKEAKIERLTGDLSKLQDDSKLKAQVLTNEINEKVQALEAFEESIDILEKLVERNEKASSQAINGLKTQTVLAEGLEADKRDLTGKYGDLEKERDDFKRKIEEIKALQGEKEEARKKVEEKEEQMNNLLDDENCVANGDVQGIEDTKKEFGEKKKKIEVQVQVLDQEKEEVEKKLEKVEEKLDDLQEKKDASAVDVPVVVTKVEPVGVKNDDQAQDQEITNVKITSPLLQKSVGDNVIENVIGDDKDKQVALVPDELNFSQLSMISQPGYEDEINSSFIDEDEDEKQMVEEKEEESKKEPEGPISFANTSMISQDGTFDDESEEEDENFVDNHEPNRVEETKEVKELVQELLKEKKDNKKKETETDLLLKKLGEKDQGLKYLGNQLGFINLAQKKMVKLDNKVNDLFKKLATKNGDVTKSGDEDRISVNLAAGKGAEKDKVKLNFITK